MTDVIDSEDAKRDGEGGYSKYLLDRVRQLEERNLKLREEGRRVETEKRFAESQKVKFEREVRKLRSELERLKTPPLVVGTIIDILQDDKVVIKSSTGPRFVVNVSQFITDGELRAGSQVALNQQSLAVVSVIPSSKDPAVYAMEIIETPDVGYNDIGGLEAQLQEVKETVELPLLEPERFEKIGIEPPKGVLLIGAPGTGKTLLAKAVANRTNATFIRVVGSELVQKYIGEGARLVRELFSMAKEKSPSILFIDEIDAIGGRRFESATSGDREVQRTLMQLLAEMDGFDPRGEVKIMGATNRPDILDPALLRPGRFDRVIMIPMPSFEARLEILRIHTANINLADEIDLEKIATITESASGADLKAIVMEAGMFAVREDLDFVTMSDFERATRKVTTSEEKVNFFTEVGTMFA
ncbi:MAG: proteasome-activating nucleotidase [Halobacteriota archaeon]|nr:proteasome-activating nucleotidase [Halobacteriota archaeon]